MLLVSFHYQDLFVSDEDSEPILGLWLEETLAPELYITTAMDSPIKSQNSSGMLGGICSANDFKASVIPDKGQEAVSES